jgi:hypothetical protein
LSTTLLSRESLTKILSFFFNTIIYRTRVEELVEMMMRRRRRRMWRRRRMYSQYYDDDE